MVVIIESSIIGGSTDLGWDKTESNFLLILVTWASSLSLMLFTWVSTLFSLLSIKTICSNSFLLPCSQILQYQWTLARRPAGKFKNSISSLVAPEHFVLELNQIWQRSHWTPASFYLKTLLQLPQEALLVFLLAWELPQAALLLLLSAGIVDKL